MLQKTKLHLVKLANEIYSHQTQDSSQRDHSIIQIPKSLVRTKLKFVHAGSRSRNDAENFFSRVQNSHQSVQNDKPMNLLQGFLTDIHFLFYQCLRQQL